MPSGTRKSVKLSKKKKTCNRSQHSQSFIHTEHRKHSGTSAPSNITYWLRWNLWYRTRFTNYFHRNHNRGGEAAAPKENIMIFKCQVEKLVTAGDFLSVSKMSFFSCTISTAQMMFAHKEMWEMRFQSFGGEHDRGPQMSLFLQRRFTNVWALIDLCVDRIQFSIFTRVEVFSSMTFWPQSRVFWRINYLLMKPNLVCHYVVCNSVSRLTLRTLVLITDLIIKEVARDELLNCSSSKTYLPRGCSSSNPEIWPACTEQRVTLTHGIESKTLLNDCWQKIWAAYKEKESG